MPQQLPRGTENSCMSQGVIGPSDAMVTSYKYSRGKGKVWRIIIRNLPPTVWNSQELLKVLPKEPENTLHQWELLGKLRWLSLPNTEMLSPRHMIKAPFLCVPASGKAKPLLCSPKPASSCLNSSLWIWFSLLCLTALKLMPCFQKLSPEMLSVVSLWLCVLRISAFTSREGSVDRPCLGT